MDCLQKIVPGVNRKHSVSSEFGQEHVDLLKQYSYWDDKLNNQKQLIDEATSKHKGNGKKE